MSWAHFSGYFTAKFWSDHVYEGDQQLAKKDAERIYMRRDVSVSSVLEMDLHALRCLVGEVTRRQAEYAAEPAGEFTSEGSYAYWERRLKRARRFGPSHFRYGVRKEAAEGAGGLYKIHHFGGVV